ncbi:cypmaclein-like isoform X1 [Rhodamnia argentea]|uniref:Cypmaclein-like isoform X1 n=1 Tax=Rhodamnia argentea TaxID=178133 RepID=A0A8B8QWT1_9MYRT|nr:cypmaclein-like isoform X1 [Rhodamnia argentea]
MASAKTSILFAILCLVLVHELLIFDGVQFQAEAQKIDCENRCNYRCSKSSRHKMCIKACNTCCQRCNCVPPGTSGNEDVCPCYANMTTHGGRHKCP